MIRELTVKARLAFWGVPIRWRCLRGVPPERSADWRSAVSRIVNPPHSRRAVGVTASRQAFTLVELLVVIGIIAVLATLALPSFRGLARTGTMDAAVRQLLDDLAFARAKALSERATVYVLFVPPRAGTTNLVILTNLAAGQFTTYTVMTKRSVGAQPGQLNPRFLTDWRSLPEGVLIPPFKYLDLRRPEFNRSVLNTYSNAFFIADRYFFEGLDPNFLPRMEYRYLAFGPTGQLVFPTGQVAQDEIIPVSRGSIFLTRDARGRVDTNSPPDVAESAPRDARGQPVRTYIRVNWLTGRARAEKLEVQ